MTRPATHDDLTEYERQGEALFSWQYGLDKVPSVQHHIVQAKITALKLGFEVAQNEVRTVLTEKELDKKLAAAQEKWDLGMVIYDQLLTRHRAYDELPWQDKNAATFYADRESLTHPSKIYEEISA
jgi:hypothetical protein